MSRSAVAGLLLLLLGGGASGAERFAVIAVGDPPAGPDGDLAELAYQLRAACRDRVPNVEDPPSMRARLLGQTSNATEAELDRAYGGALAVYQNGEFESALRTLRAIVEDLEALPETAESYFQWKRALLRLAHAAMGANDAKEVEGAFGKLSRMEPTLLPDPDQFSPGFRKRFEEVKVRVRALPRRRLTIAAEGRQGTVFVNGKAVGTSPLTVTLPTGTYRVGGAAGVLRVPSFRVDLEQEDRTVVLDFALAESLRMSAGPGLALAAPNRAYGIVRAGAWLGVDKIVSVTRADEGQAQFLVGSIYDVLRGALLREGSVRMVAGGVPSVNLYALSSFLLTGQSSREVKDLSRELGKRAGSPEAAPGTPPISARAATPTSPPPTASAAPSAAPATSLAARAPAPATPSPAQVLPEPPRKAAEPPVPALAREPAATSAASPELPKEPGPAAGSRLEPKLSLDPARELDRELPGKGVPEPSSSGGLWSWTGKAAIGSGVLAAGFLALALQQNGAANHAYSQADDQLRPDGGFKDASAQARWSSLRSDAASARRNATLSVGAAAALGVTTAVLGWKAWHARPGLGPQLALKF